MGGSATSVPAMLQQRQKGLEALHGAALMALGVGTFVGFAAWIHRLGIVTFAESMRWEAYFGGVVLAMVWVRLSLRGVAGQLMVLGWIRAIRLTLQQLTRMSAVLFLIAFLLKDAAVSRAFLLGYLVVAGGVLLLANRWLPLLLARMIFQRQRFRTVLVARQDEASDLKQWLAERAHLGVNLVGFVGEGKILDLPCLGPVWDLRGIVERYAVEQVVISRSRGVDPELEMDATALEESGCRVRYFASMQALFGSQAQYLGQDGAYAFATAQHEPLDDPMNRAVKRLFDLVVSVPVVFLVLPPLILVVWILQRVQSPGPVFYRQMRTGMNRRKFQILKFRTMNLRPANDVAQQATKGDPRVYPFGRFLRRSSLDEMPQFLNVLVGDMSVSGPRPHLLEHDETFARMVSGYRQRHYVKPGITGLAQSRGFRGEIIEPRLLLRRLRYDLIYVTRWSLLLDVKIMIATVLQVLFPPKSAY
jgi:exopolysaccharide biosynthesis polyprenyl glycosylphosphotransferase